jgi:hypothetical protein
MQVEDITIKDSQEGLYLPGGNYQRHRKGTRSKRKSI